MITEFYTPDGEWEQIPETADADTLRDRGDRCYACGLRPGEGHNTTAHQIATPATHTRKRAE